MHQLPDAKELFEVVAYERNLLPTIIEKDYWLMHCLWGLQAQGYKFELKGGTSLSKGFGIIERFSEDIDIQIYPLEHHSVKIGKNQDRPSHIESRRKFFDDIAKDLAINDLIFERDTNFDDTKKMRSGGIRAVYNSHFTSASEIKNGIVLELGFDKTTPNIPCDITSWAFEKALSQNLFISDNRAKQVPCYCPEYTLVEKLQTISTKYRIQQERKSMPINFLRHYYDVYRLLECERVLSWIGSDDYKMYKESRFPGSDEIDIRKNNAFIMPKADIKKLFSEEFKKKSALYFGKQPEFEEILNRIKKYSDVL